MVKSSQMLQNQKLTSIGGTRWTDRPRIEVVVDLVRESGTEYILKSKSPGGGYQTVQRLRIGEDRRPSSYVSGHNSERTNF